MSDDPKYLTVQATRSFNEFTQGDRYRIDSGSERMMTLLGAGYFSEEYYPNLVVSRPEEGNYLAMAEQEHVNVDAGWQPADDVQVPEKMTGSQRATTADEEQADGTVGTESTGDSGDRTSRRTASRKSSGTRDN